MPIRLALSPRIRAALRFGLVGLGGLLLAGLAGIAALIASRDYATIERETIARLEQETGTVFRFAGRRHVLWPKPKIVFDSVSLAQPGEAPIVQAPQTILSFDLIDLLDGRIDSPSVTLVDPEIVVASGRLDSYVKGPRAILGVIESLSSLFDDRSRFARLRLQVQNGTIRLLGAAPDGAALAFGNVNGRLRYSSSRGRIDMTAVQHAADNMISASLSLPTRKSLRSDKAQNAAIVIEGLGSRLALDGTMRGDGDLAVTGQVEAALAAPLERQLMAQPPGDRRERSADPTSLAALMTLDNRGVALEMLKIGRGDRQLSGIAALRELNGRWGISGTLAGDLVDGSAASAVLQSLRTKEGTWSDRPLTINPLPGFDLDIRLSTRQFRLGNVVLGGAAVSILTRPGRTELAIVDSHFGDGTIKARIALAETPEGVQDLRLQASGERVDVGQLMERAVGFNRLVGSGNLVLQAEGRGMSVAGLVANLGGSAAAEIRGGEIIGIDLQRLLARSTDSRSEAALVFALAGKTPFDHLKANFALKDGRIEPVGSTFSSSRVDAMLEGATDLGAQRHRLAIVLRRKIDEPGQPNEFFAFRLEGPLFAPSLKPDLKLLSNRS